MTAGGGGGGGGGMLNDDVDVDFKSLICWLLVPSIRREDDEVC